MPTMRQILLVLLVAFTSIVAAWDSEDHDIFRLRDDVELAEGAGATFYSFLGVEPNASLEELRRAKKKRSKQLHPDRAIPSMLNARTVAKASGKPKSGQKPGVHVRKGPSQRERAEVTKEATARYARLSVVAEILMTPQRERYDHFMKNGFPRWRGSGYYYARFRPGLGSVLAGLLIIFGGGAHYGALYLSWKRQRDFVERYIKHARRTAWGNESGIPGLPGLNGSGNGFPSAVLADEDTIPEGGLALNRKQKRMQEKESKRKDNTRPAKSVRQRDISSPVEAEMISGPRGTKKKVVAENGKVLIVDSVGNVYLEDTTEEGEKHEFLLDPEEIPRPTIYQTVLFRLPIWAYQTTVGRVLGRKGDADLLDGSELTVPEDESGDVLQSATPINANREHKKRKSKAKTH